MKFAVLRQPAEQMLGVARRRWPWLGAPDVEPTLPAYTARLFKLAHIAVGDADSAAVLTADVLAQQPADESAALHLLIKLLPDGWLSWPGAAGPAEWLRLRLRREQADRVLSVLGEWDPGERIALGLYLLYDVRRDDLDAWLGSHDMAERVAEFIGYVGEGLDLVPLAGERASCADVVAELIDAHDPLAGRAIRLHTLGCAPCRNRARGLVATTQLLRRALQVFFRVAPPAELPRLVMIRRRQQQQTRRPARRWKLGAAALAMLMFYFGVLRQPESAASLAPPPPQNARQLLDRALNRFNAPPLQTGILHERVRLGDDATAPILERWYDWTMPNRLRVTVQLPDRSAPSFDLATDGEYLLAYSMDTGNGSPQRVLVRDKNVGTLMPLVRQLPLTNGFADQPAFQDRLDVPLLAAARRGRPTLLGMTMWRGRPAYMVAGADAAGGRTILTIDQQTFSLLEARISANDGGGASRRVWQAEAVEVLPRANVRPATFELDTLPTTLPIVNPRQLSAAPLANIDLLGAVIGGPLPMPQRLRDPAVISYLRRQDGQRSAIIQRYEGQWSTLVIVVPRALQPTPLRQLDQAFDHGRYAAIGQQQPQTTTVEFELDRMPGVRMRLSLWHALATDAERAAMVRATLNDLVLVGRSDVSAYADRFLPPTGIPEPSGSVAQPVRYTTRSRFMR